MAFADSYFDIGSFFVNDLIGDLWLAAIVTIIAVVLYSLRKKIPLEAITVILILTAALIFEVTGLEHFFIFAVLIAGGLFYWFTSRGMG